MLLKILSVVAFAVASFVVYSVYQNLSEPNNLGLRDGQLAPLSSKPNGVSSQTEMEDKRVPALPFKEDIKTSFSAVKEALLALGNVEIVEEKDGYIRGVARSPLMRYRDDVEVFLDAASGEVHYRSQSRIGYSDMGVNRARFDAFKTSYDSHS